MKLITISKLKKKKSYNLHILINSIMLAKVNHGSYNIQFGMLLNNAIAHRSSREIKIHFHVRFSAC